MSQAPIQKKRPAILATSVAALLSLGLLMVGPRSRADEYWDGTNMTGSNQANGAGGIGQWDTSSTNWVDVNGQNFMQYDPNQLAIFSTTGGTVTLGTDISFTALRFDVNGYSIESGSGPFKLSPTGTATITVQPSVGVTFDAQLTGSGSVDLEGGGTMTLTNGANDYSGGTTVGSGSTLIISNDTNLGNTTGGLTLNGGTLQAATSVTSGRTITLSAGGGTFSTAGGTTLELDGPIGGAGALVATGGGTVSLTNPNNNYQGGTTIATATTLLINSDGNLGNTGGGLILNGGTLQISSNVTTARPVMLGATGGGTFSAPSGLILEMDGAVGGTGQFFAVGGGQIILTNTSNTYQGGTTISAGTTVSIANDGSLGATTGNLTLASGILQTTANIVSARAIILASGGGTFSANSGTTLELDGIISGSGGLTASGQGTVKLTAANTYLGGTDIGFATTLVVNNDGNLGKTSGGLTFDGGILQPTANLTSTRAVTVNVGGGTVAVAGGATVEFDGVIAGTGALTFTGVGGTVKLGNSGNTYQGGTDIGNGTTVVVKSDSSLGGSTGTLTFDGGTLQTTGTSTGSRPITLNAGGGTFVPAAGTTLDIFGTIGGAGGLTLNGPGTIILESSANNYAGATTITSGTLRAGSVNTVPGTSAVSVNTGATFDLNNFSQSVGYISNGVGGGGTIKLGSGTLTTGASNTSTAFGGAIQDGGSGGGLTKVGTGTFTLTGANTYTGATTVNGGTLLINPATNPSVLSSSSALVVGGGTFQFNGVVGTTATQVLNGLTVNKGLSEVAVNNLGTTTTLDLRGSSGTQGIVRNTGGFVDFDAITGTLGVNAFILTNQANDATGIIGTWATVNGGSAFATRNAAGDIVAYSGYTDINALGPNTVPNNSSANVRIETLGTAGPVPLSAATTNINTLTQDFTTASTIDTSLGTLRLGTTGGLVITPAAANLTIGTAPNAGILTAGGATSNVAGEILIQNNSSTSALTVNSTITDNGTGAVTIIVGGIGRTVFAGADTYTGTTTISDGTLQAGAANTIPIGSAVRIDTLGTFDLNNFNQSVASIADGPNGGGKITLGSATLTTGSDNTSTTFSGVISGAGILTKVGTGALTLAGANTYSGGTVIDKGTVVISSDGNLGNAIGGVTLDGSTLQTTASITSARAIALNAGGGTFTPGAGTTLDLTGVVSGPGALTAMGGGTLELANVANTFMGGTNIGSGTTVIITNDGSLGNGGGVTIDAGTLQTTANVTTSRTITLNSGGGTLAAASGTIFTINKAITGSGALTIGGSGTVLLTVPNTYGGFTKVTSGTLQAGAANILPANSQLLVNTGATFDLNNFAQSVGSIADSTGGGGTIKLGTATLTTGTDNNSTTFSGVITDAGAATAGSLTKVGTGTLTIAGANTYRGATTISAGTLQTGATNTIPSTSTVLVDKNGTLALNGFSDAVGSIADGVSGGGTINLGSGALTTGSDNTSTTFSGVILGTGSLTKVGTGTLFLRGANTYTGATTISTGALQAGAANTIPGTSAVVVSASGTLNLNGFAQSVGSISGAGTINIGAVTLTTGGDNTSTNFSGKILDGGAGGGLTKIGTGTLTLSSATIVYSGATTITGGTLQVGAANAIPTNSAVLIGPSGTLALTTFTQTLASVADGPGGGGTINLGSATLSVDSNNASTTFSGLIEGAGTLAKVGTGKLTLTNAASTYTGGTDINVGTLAIGNDGSLGGASSGVFFGGGTLETTANVTSGRTYTINAAGGTFSPDAGTTLTVSGLVTGSGVLTVNGAGTLQLSGTSNNYTGATTITSGTLQAGAVNTLSSKSAVLIGSGGTLDLNSFSQTVGSIANGAGGGTIKLGSGTLTTGANNTSTAFGGTIQGSGGLTKIGTGTFTLSGANTYTGSTTVNGGVLLINSATNPSVLSSASGLVVGGGTFQLNGVAGATIDQVLNGLTVNKGSSEVLVNNGTGTSTTLDLRGTSGTQGIVRQAGGFVDFDTAGNAFILTNQANDATGIIGTWATVNGGSALATRNALGQIVAYTGYTNLNALGPNQVPNNSAANLLIDGQGTAGPVLISAATTNINTLTQDFATASTIDTSPGTLRVGVTGGIFITPTGASLTIGTAPNAGILTAGGATSNVAGELILQNNSANLLTINSTITDNGTGAVTITVGGTGTTILAGANTYSGATTISSGTLQAGAVNTIPVNSAVRVDSAGTLDLNNFSQSVGSIANGPNGGGTIKLGTATLTTGNDNTSTLFSGVIQGGGGLTKVGTGTLTLAGANSYGGATTISDGTLRAGAVNVIPSTSAVLVGKSGTLDLNNFSQNVGSIADGSGGGGTIDLGTATLTAGTNNSTTSFSGVLQDGGAGGSLTKVGSGTLTLAGANNYDGTTTVSAGTLQAGATNTIPGGSTVVVSLGATLNLNNFSQSVSSIADGAGGGGTITLGTAVLTVGNNLPTSTTFSGLLQGAGSLVKNGTSTLTLSNPANSYTGGTTLNAGTLNANGSSTDGTGTPLGTGTLTIKGGTLGTTIEPTTTTDPTGNPTGTILTNKISVLGNFSIATNVDPSNPGQQNITLNGLVDLNGATRTITGVTDGGQVHFGVGGIGVAGETAGVNFNTTFTNAGDYVAFIFNPGNTNKYTGLTTVNNGAFIVFEGTTLNGAIQGNVDIEGNGVVDYLGNLAGGVDVSNQIADTATVTVNSTGNTLSGTHFDGLELRDFSETIATLNGKGSVGLGSGTLTVGSGNFTGVIEDGAFGAGGNLTKVGPGTLILSGANNYSGKTTISAGTLQAGATQTIPSTSAVLVNTGGTFDLNSFDQFIGSIANGASGGGTIDLGSARLIAGFDNTSTTFSGVIQDGPPGTISGTGGSLVKVGTGTLTINGTSNTYTGATYVSAGTLLTGAANTIPSKSGVLVDLGSILDLDSNKQSVGSLSDGPNGGGTVSLGSANFVIGNDNTTTAFSGVIQDGGVSNGTGGSLTKVGFGTQFLSGASTYTGPTTINDGTLELSGSVTSVVQVNDTGTFVLDTGGKITPTVAGATPVNVNVGGTFSNFAQLVNTGAGSVGTALTGDRALVTNNGASSLTSGVALISGETGITVTNPSGQATIANFGTITGTGGTAINATTSAGVKIANFGTINGQVLLGTGNNTIVLATDLIAPLIQGGAGVHDTLELAGAGARNFDLATVTGFEGLNKVGGGLWTLTGTNTFVNGTVISGGIVNLVGTLTSNTSLESGSSLVGTGTIIGNLANFGVILPGAPLTANGIIVPDSALGTLTIRGNYTQNSGGALVIQIGGHQAGQYDVLSIGGQAQLAGTLELQQLSKGPDLKIGNKIVFLTASGGVSGQFSNVINPFATGTIIVAKVVYDANDVALEGAQGSFLSLQRTQVLTPNEKAVAGALDKAVSSKTASKLINYLDSRPVEKLAGDFDKISPEAVASVFRLGTSLADVQTRNLQRRTSDIRAGVSGFSASGFQASGSGPNYSGGLAGPNGTDDKAGNVPAPDRRLGVFVTGTGDFVHVGSTDNARGYDLDTGGLTVGVDYKLTPNLAVGLNAGYAGTNAKLADSGRLQVNGGKLGVYGTYYTGGFYTDVTAGGGLNDYSLRRAALQGDARGSTQGAELDASVDAGYDWRLDALTIGPTASFQYTYLGIDSFTERGSLAPLHYGSQHGDSLRSSLGLKASYDWKVGAILLRPEVQVAWQHEFGDQSYAVDSSLAGSPGSLLTVSDSQIGRDSLLVSGGVALLWNPRTSAYLYYDADVLRKEYSSQSVTGGFKLNF